MKMGSQHNGGRKIPPAAYEGAIQGMMSQHTGVRWAVENGMFTFQANSILELVEKTEPFCLTGIASLIQCPTLVCKAEADHFFAGQPQRLFDELTCPKTIMAFTQEDGAEEHCQMGALQLYNHRLFEWLDHVMNVVPR
ncbi:hypothetical protein [Paenibacillus hexagrammi]|uniref:Uncharacterized protein n=1 Tax=Paenibacillus hexagrammi TaxID=2908839 RepID=A0ABY3SJK1_9BACL|nr:hypothetical protein [Paenibacillus sp. YPD9-1]UJF33396.1 hypothetical protein L0M14_28465 [Paenibacillus sp. YPD9-1]